MTEKNFQENLVNGLRHHGFWAHKLPDLARGVNKPFDIVACWSAQFWAIEVKLAKFKRSMQKAQISGKDRVVKQTDLSHGQHKNLTEILTNEGNALIAAFICNDFDPQIARGWIIDYKTFMTRDSWTVDELIKLDKEFYSESYYSFELTRVPYAGWCLYPDKE